MNKKFNIANSLIAEILDEAVRIQQIASPTFYEQERAEYVKKRFIELGLDNVYLDDVNNVYSRRPGGNGKAILVSAHLDTVFPFHTDLTSKRLDGKIYGPGIGDNSLSVASLIGLQNVFNQLNIQLPGDVYFVANSCEEGLGDLKGIKNVISEIGSNISGIIAVEGSGFTRLNYRGIGSKRYRISIKSPGGHSWSNFGEESAIHLLVRLANTITDWLVEEIPKTTFNIGKIEGGASVNTIAEEASMLVDLRSESKDALDELVDRLGYLLSSFESKKSILKCDIVGDRPAGELAATDSVLITALKTYDDFGVSEPDILPSSTDINYPLSLGYSAICVGLTDVFNVHREDEYLIEKPFYDGFKRLANLIVNISEALNT